MDGVGVAAGCVEVPASGDVDGDGDAPAGNGEDEGDEAAVLGLEDGLGCASGLALGSGPRIMPVSIVETSI